MESWRRRNRRETRVEASWRIGCGGTAMEQNSWSRINQKEIMRRKRRGGALNELSWRRNQGSEIMEVKLWRNRAG